MNLNDVVEWCRVVHPRHQTRKISDEARACLDAVFPGIPLRTQLELARQGATAAPTCQVCGGPLTTYKPTTKTCSHLCRQQLRRLTGAEEIAQQKKKQTTLARFGVDNPMKCNHITEQVVATKRRKFGGSGQSEQARAQARERMLAKSDHFRSIARQLYGVDNVSQAPSVRDKVVTTLQAKYGATSLSQIPAVQQWREEESIKLLQSLTPNLNLTITPHTQQSSQTKYMVEFECGVCSRQNSMTSGMFKYRCKQGISPCAHCSDSHQRSAAERQIVDWVSSLVPEGVRVNARDVIAPYELDIYLPHHKIAIEYCGLYWHSEDIRTDKLYHLRKHNLCADQGIKLIQIFEDEWRHKSDVVKARIKHMLLTSTRIYARNTVCEPLEREEASAFLEATHVQGVGTFKYAYGLKHNGSLVAVMTFGRPNRSKNGGNQYQWELVRFSSVGSVVGGASKLFRRFVRDHQPTTVLSFSDKRWGDGNLYRQIGFEWRGSTPVNYWYVDFGKCKRIHRYSLRKTDQDDRTKTETQLRREQGWTRIWDCGSDRFLWDSQQAQN